MDALESEDEDIPSTMKPPVLKKQKTGGVGKMTITPAAPKKGKGPVVPRPQTQTKLNFDLGGISSSSDDEPDLTCTEVSHSKLIEECICENIDARRAMYAQLCLPAIVGDDQKGDGYRLEWKKEWADKFYLVNFYHGYNPSHLFGAMLNTLEFVYSATSDGRIRSVNLAECLENITLYFLSVRTGIFSGKLLPLPGTSLIRMVECKHYQDYCCTAAYSKPKVDKGSALLEHIFKHYTHEPTKLEHAKFKNPWLGKPDLSLLKKRKQ